MCFNASATRHSSGWDADLTEGQSMKHLTQLAVAVMLVSALAAPGGAAPAADKKQAAPLRGESLFWFLASP